MGIPIMPMPWWIFGSKRLSNALPAGFPGGMVAVTEPEATLSLQPKLDISAGCIVMAMVALGLDNLYIIDRSGAAIIPGMDETFPAAPRLLPKHAKFASVWQSIMLASGGNTELSGIFHPAQRLWHLNDRRIQVNYEPRSTFFVPDRATAMIGRKIDICIG